ncbi:MAG: NUDIX domain-containing protein [Mycoplasmataceae bacterium]|jgi:8-oxo-dGTP pyrophosphatase MutT (NUDIX family)|nr:NUDIX domain-containing protein [Mycoplasmataceae bacterium]
MLFKKKQADKFDEILRVVDKNGNWTGTYKTRGEIHDNGFYHNNVAVWIINKKNMTILLEHRSPDKTKNPDRWCLVGGHIANDETPSQAAINEVKEEIGIKLKRKEVKFLCITPPVNNAKSFTYHFYFISNKIFNWFKIQKEELTEIRYINYNDWKKLVKHGSDKVAPKWNKYKIAFDLMDQILK